MQTEKYIQVEYAFMTSSPNKSSKMLWFENICASKIFNSFFHGEIIYGGTRWIEDDRSATFSEYIFLFIFPACLMISHWLTKNAELNSVF